MGTTEDGRLKEHSLYCKPNRTKGKRRNSASTLRFAAEIRNSSFLSQRMTLHHGQHRILAFLLLLTIIPTSSHPNLLSYPPPLIPSSSYTLLRTCSSPQPRRKVLASLAAVLVHGLDLVQHGLLFIIGSQASLIHRLSDRPDIAFSGICPLPLCQPNAADLLTSSRQPCLISWPTTVHSASPTLFDKDLRHHPSAPPTSLLAPRLFLHQSHF